MAKKTKNKEAEIAFQNNMFSRYAYNFLKSELDGVYVEMDKLCKKAPREPLSDLQTTIVNGVIHKTKHFLAEDTIVKEVSPFVPAGDNPEYRDALTVLQQLRQALNRFHDKNQAQFTYTFESQMKNYDITDAHVAHLFTASDTEA
jgi:hypothetical protein